MSLAAITQAAHEWADMHPKSINGTWCVTCHKTFPCPDRVVAERVVQLAADVAAKEDEIRERLECAYRHVAPNRAHTHDEITRARDDLRSALEILGCRGCDRAESAKRPDGNYTHDIPGCRL